METSAAKQNDLRNNASFVINLQVLPTSNAHPPSGYLWVIFTTENPGAKPQELSWLVRTMLPAVQKLHVPRGNPT